MARNEENRSDGNPLLLLTAGFILGSIAWLIGGWIALAQGPSGEPRGTPAQILELIGFRVAAICVLLAALLALQRGRSSDR